ncbi:hypothetical protein B0H16DRAFT_1856588 [Mycena metata]|uniref:Uncharacterized protein n=1 Tax=Mycena metata TaxID=1033252 RepID=A0AAD7N3P6_9AGAR|nr:hypothetical protein B0H16DRAFT_1856588 [Mycena metata]
MNGTAQIISGFISFGTLHIHTSRFEPWQWLFINTHSDAHHLRVFLVLLPRLSNNGFLPHAAGARHCRSAVEGKPNGVENKHFKKEQCVGFTSVSGPFPYSRSDAHFADFGLAIVDFLTARLWLRYREFLFACRLWRFLALQRRSGQAHNIDVSVPHRRPGSLTIRCPACPEFGFNISEETMREVLEQDRCGSRSVGSAAEILYPATKSRSTKEMNAGHRHDVVDDQSNNRNREKMTASTLLRLYRIAVSERRARTIRTITKSMDRAIGTASARARAKHAAVVLTFPRTQFPLNSPPPAASPNAVDSIRESASSKPRGSRKSKSSVSHESIQRLTTSPLPPRVAPPTGRGDVAQTQRARNLRTSRTAADNDFDLVALPLPLSKAPKLRPRRFRALLIELRAPRIARRARRAGLLIHTPPYNSRPAQFVRPERNSAQDVQ